MERKIKVYVASVYTNGGKITNKRKLLENALDSLEVGDHLINLGYAPYIPLLNHFQDYVYPRSPKEWLDLDFEWLKVCDCVLRLNDKESDGVNKELLLANKLGIPVFTSMGNLKLWTEQKRLKKTDIDIDNIKDLLNTLNNALKKGEKT